MKEYCVIYETVDGYVSSVLREGTYTQVESWAYQQMKNQEWQSFGIKESNEYTWAETA